MKFSQIIPLGRQIVVTGGGGKTGLIAAVETELAALRRPALVSLTTLLGRGQFPWLQRVEARTLDEAVSAARRAAGGERILLAGPPGPRSDKLSGVDPAWFPALWESAGQGLTMLIEADGSRGRPLKAYRAGEPPLPLAPPAVGPNFVMAVLGLSVLTLPAAEAVHRPEELAAVIGPFDAARPLGPEQVAAYVQAGWGRLEPDLIFLNQTDALPGGSAHPLAAQLARLLGGHFRTVFASLFQNNLEV